MNSIDYIAYHGILSIDPTELITSDEKFTSSSILGSNRIYNKNYSRDKKHKYKRKKISFYY